MGGGGEWDPDQNQFDGDNTLVKTRGTTVLVRCNFSPRRKSNCILIEEFIWHILVVQTVILIHCLADKYALWSASDKKKKDRQSSPQSWKCYQSSYCTTVRWSKSLIAFLSGSICGTERDYLSTSQNFDLCHITCFLSHLFCFTVLFSVNKRWAVSKVDMSSEELIKYTLICSPTLSACINFK